jgi:hypothetical protein
LLIWSKVFSMLPGIVKMSPRSAMVIRAVERGDLPDALRPEPGARAVGGAAVERCAEDRDVVVAAGAHVLDVGGLQERVDTREVRELAA